MTYNRLLVAVREVSTPRRVAKHSPSAQRCFFSLQGAQISTPQAGPATDECRAVAAPSASPSESPVYTGGLRVHASVLVGARVRRMFQSPAACAV